MTTRQITLADLKPGLVFDHPAYSEKKLGLVVGFDGKTLSYYWNSPHDKEHLKQTIVTEGTLRNLVANFPDKPKRRL